MFSVVVPTFNNIEYLKLCLRSLKKNSNFKHEYIIHVNEGIDGSLEFIKSNNYKFTYSKVNEGVCVAFNKASNQASNKYIVLAHDDMYFCPGWDTVFVEELKKIKNDEDFFLSGTMVQPFASYLEFNCGKTYQDFNEEKLLKGVNKIKFDDFQGSHWQPSLIPKKTWDKVGGFSEEFSPGLGSDPDFNMKLWNQNVRIFKGLNDFKVYHFGSVTTRKKKNLTQNRGDRTFLKKWGITTKFFKKYYLKSKSKFEGPLTEPKKNIDFYLNLIICKIKRLLIFS